MESRWYVPPGQHVSTTKIADRQLALHIADKSWKSIIKHLDRKRVIQEEIEAREAHRKAMKEGSESMTKNWSNSVEQVRKVKEENLRRKKEKEEEDRMNNYMMLKKEQQEIRDEFLAKMRKKMIMRKQHPRNLNTALIASNVQKTREKQIEFAQMMRDHDMAEEDKYAAKVKREAQEEVVENKEKAERIRKKNVEMRDLYLKEIREHKEALAEARRKRIEEEAVDIQKGIEEYEKIQTVRKEEVHEQKMKNREVYAKFFEQKQQLKRIEEQEQREREQIIDIIKASEHRMMCLTLQRKRELHEQALLRQKKAAELLVANLGTTEEEDERILQRALAEQDEAEKRKQEEIRLHKKKVDEDMKAYREQLKQNAAEAKEEEEEMYKWEMLNRFKQDDVIKQHEKDLLEARRNQIMNYRKEILDQIDEDREKQRKEKEEMDYAIIPWDEEDREFFAYADEVMETVKKRGQSTYPVERAIHEYKKFNSLLEKPKDKASKTNPNLLNTTPGKMAHHPDSDPTYRRLKKQEKEKECKKCCDSLQKPADEVCKPSNEKKQTQ